MDAPRQSDVRRARLMLLATLVAILLLLPVEKRQWRPALVSSQHRFPPEQPSGQSIPPLRWWLAPRPPQAKVGWFNASVLYLKPHKTGSETFKHVLLNIAAYYNMTTDHVQEHRQLSEWQARQPKHAVDVLLRHTAYQRGLTELRVRGWCDGAFDNPQATASGKPCRRLIRVVTVRDPVQRLFSHYFSQRRFGRYRPAEDESNSGGDGDDSRRESSPQVSFEREVGDFLDWLSTYPGSQQTRYLTDRGVARTRTGDSSAVGQLFGDAERVAREYDHVIIADDWWASLCTFGLREGVAPQLLRVAPRNRNGPGATRFDVTRAMADAHVADAVFRIVQYDFVLHARLVAAAVRARDALDGVRLAEYCRCARDAIC